MNIKAIDFRAKQNEDDKAIRDVITTHYASFYEVAEFASKKKLPPFKVETPFGDWIITPKL